LFIGFCNFLFVILKVHQFCEMKFSSQTCLPVYPPLVGLPACGWQAGNAAESGSKGKYHAS
jgi:hypothetical protein